LRPAGVAKAGPRWVRQRGTAFGAFHEQVSFQAGRKSADRPNWLREIKFDGYRMAARIDSGKVQLLTRSGLDWTAKYPTTEVRRETSSF
jgi:ATP-dependent DNA ligase